MCIAHAEVEHRPESERRQHSDELCNEAGETREQGRDDCVDHLLREHEIAVIALCLPETQRATNGALRFRCAVITSTLSDQSHKLQVNAGLLVDLLAKILEVALRIRQQEAQR